MPLTFILALLVGFIAVVATFIWLGTKSAAKSRGSNEFLPGVVPVVAGFLAIAFLVLASLTTVGPRSIGIVTAFGKPVDALDSGLHLKAPWQKVNDLDGKKQTTNFGGPGDSDYDTVSVRLGSEGSAEVQASVRWSITTDREGATALYQDFRDMDKITDSLIARETRSAVGLVFNSFNPLAKIEPVAGGNEDGGTLPTYDQFSKQVQDRLESKVGKFVNIDSVIIQYVQYDKGTQNKLNAYAQEVAETRVAQQREETAKAQSRANKALSNSISNDPNVLVKQCFDSLDKLAEKGKVPPVAFSCWPGAGSTEGLIVNGR